MTKAATAQAYAAQTLLNSCMRQLRDDVQYTAAYETHNCKRLIINRQIHSIGIFVESYPGDGQIQGVAMVRTRSPGYYSATTPRAASVMRDERLGMGNEIFYLRCDSLGALERFVHWYGQQ